MKSHDEIGELAERLRALPEPNRAVLVAQLLNAIDRAERPRHRERWRAPQTSSGWMGRDLDNPEQ